MNAAFCARLKNIRIDGILLGHDGANPWLKQVVALTGGLLVHDSEPNALPQLVGTCGSVGTPQDALDQRPSQLTGRQQVNISKCCSACLTLLDDKADAKC